LRRRGLKSKILEKYIVHIDFGELFNPDGSLTPRGMEIAEATRKSGGHKAFNMWFNSQLQGNTAAISQVPDVKDKATMARYLRILQACYDKFLFDADVFGTRSTGAFVLAGNPGVLNKKIVQRSKVCSGSYRG
jgi:hypothetical protein